MYVIFPKAFTERDALYQGSSQKHFGVKFNCKCGYIHCTLYLNVNYKPVQEAQPYSDSYSNISFLYMSCACNPEATPSVFSTASARVVFCGKH